MTVTPPPGTAWPPLFSYPTRRRRARRRLAYLLAGLIASGLLIVTLAG